METYVVFVDGCRARVHFGQRTLRMLLSQVNIYTYDVCH